ncbi:polysaccharide biosynthesis protein [Desulfobacterales bacterium HSG2]|nr:polysaccharide biosynthesis protein [Desulfobacterales bacterium HSG2]
MAQEQCFSSQKSEACSLILQAGAIGEGGEIFILKMGIPVRISDMARDMISMSGFRPGEEIEIRYSGLRPGEKLYEELITEGEEIRKTGHEDIMVLATDGHRSMDEMNRHLDRLAELGRAGDGAGIKEYLRVVVPEYCPETDFSTPHHQRFPNDKQRLSG